MKLLEGKVAIITGASRGIGKGIAEGFAKHGANIAFTYSSSVESALALENELNAVKRMAKKMKDEYKFENLKRFNDFDNLNSYIWIKNVKEFILKKNLMMFL